MADRTVYRITTQIVNPDKTLGDLVDIVEMESLLEPAKASSYQLWNEYTAAQKDIDERCTCVFEDGDSMACPVHNPLPGVYGCPHCKSTDSFSEKNTVIVDYNFDKFSDDGTCPDDSTYGDSRVCWESADAVKDEETYHCWSCDGFFAEPILIEAKVTA